MKAPDVDPEGDAEASAPTSLLQRLRARDDRAWERLDQLYGLTVLGWCRRFGLSPEDADDVRQEVFQAVARSIADFRRDRPGDSFRGWLWVVTRSKARDHQRRQAKRTQAAGGSTARRQLEQVPGEDESGCRDVAELAAEEQALYRRALALIQSNFSERTWRAFWAVAVDGRAAAEVGAGLGMSTGAVYIAKSRVLAHLREEFADLL
jgi:RNA polymerase sigma-70 factor (ECF subfamily)